MTVRESAESMHNCKNPSLWAAELRTRLMSVIAIYRQLTKSR